MRQIPMLFSPAMIEALLAGRKTETRRILKPQPDPGLPIGGASFIEGDEAHPLGRWVWRNGHDGSIVGDHMGHRTRPGDVIWVKETHWAYGRWRLTGEKTATGKGKLEFVRNRNAAQDGCVFSEPTSVIGVQEPSDVDQWHKRPSLFLEKADSRLSLRVAGFNIERLRQISEDAAQREGCAPRFCWPGEDSHVHTQPTYRMGYAHLWDEINGDGSWAKDPWVEATRFEVVRQNVLQVAA